MAPSNSLLVFIFMVLPSFILAHQFNTIDSCWRSDNSWKTNRQKLATCSVGFSGKMSNNIGKDLKRYEVVDPSDDPIKPKVGTLRYGATMLKGKKWITFKRSMTIALQKPLYVSSFTTIDGRGADVHIAGNGCLILNRVRNVIVHNVNIHDCKAQTPGLVMRPSGIPRRMGGITDGDAIRVLNSSNVWIDHNSLYNCVDGLLDVSRGSTGITVSNNWFRDQDKVMLLGHRDQHKNDMRMKVTVVYNRFGPNCNQRMPRVRHGYVHVANNYYDGWKQYAIGGSMSPTIISEGNYFVAPRNGNSKEVTWHANENILGFYLSRRDIFANGAIFSATIKAKDQVNYKAEDAFEVVDPKLVEKITRDSGALKL